MREDSALDFSVLRVDGGMAVNQWFLQFLADQCQLKVQKPKDIETTARGAAILAGIGHGVFDSLNSVWKPELEIEPQRAINEVERDYRGWNNALNKIKLADE